jgi:dienelactone hydrolase
MLKKWLTLALSFFVAVSVMAQGNYLAGDPMPGAPELAPRGAYGVGVQTLSLSKPNSLDVLNARIYDRPLTVEVWYPAIIPDGVEQLTTYNETFGRADVEGSLSPFAFEGRALRDAQPNAEAAPYPLVVVSHGYPGSRFMMTNLTENLASKGYVVVAIDHTDSTFLDVANFGSTLINRTADQRFVIDQMAELGAGDGFLAGLVDADNTAIIGYSMGGFGALATIGAGYNQVLANFLGEAAKPILFSETYEGDSRVKAAVLFSPWGGDLRAVGAPGVSFWNADALANITAPTLWISGSRDDVAIHEGIVKLFDSAVNSERFLLTYVNGLHNTAPNPPVAETVLFRDYERYSEPVWDRRHMININQHFITAFLGQYLKGEDNSKYLNLAVEDANDGVYSVDDAGNPTAEHTYWAGFTNRTAVGLTFRAGE